MPFPTLQAKLTRYEEIERLLQDADVLADTARMVELQREHGGLGKVAMSIRAFNRLEGDMQAAQEMVAASTDAEEKAYAQSELDELRGRYEAMRTELEDMVTAGDSLTRGSLIMEFEPGPAARRPPCSLMTCSTCTPATATSRAGSTK